MLRVQSIHHPASMHLLILGAILFAQTTHSEYNHDVAPHFENFFPSLADPWGQIKCYGPMPPFEIPTYPLPAPFDETANPNEWTLQQLCAKPQYGGKGRYRHLGGFCQRYTELDGYFGGEMGGDTVRDNDHYRPFAFDTSPRARPMPYRMLNPRLLQFCQQRCFCSAWATESTFTPPEMIYVQLRPGPISFLSSYADTVSGSQINPVSLDLPYGQSDGVLSYERSWNMALPGTVAYETSAMIQGYGLQKQLQSIYAEFPELHDESFGYHMNQTIIDPPPALYERTYTTLSPANEIVCVGDTPDWHWWTNIGPYDSWNMTQETFWQTVGATTPPLPHIPNDGGLQGAVPFPVLGPAPPVFPFVDRSQLPITNLQQLCANALSGGNPLINAGGYCHRNGQDTADVWFTDEVTPHLNMTWDMFQKSAAIRFLCWRQCECKYPQGPPEKRFMRRFWQLVAFSGISSSLEGDQFLSFKTHSGQSSSSAKTGSTGSFKLPSSKSYSCAPRQGGCQDGPWPTELLGPRPSTPVLTPVVNLDTCGGECYRNKDCGAGSDLTCRCVVPKTELIPLDPVFPVKPIFDVGRCLDLTATSLSSFVGRRKLRRESTFEESLTSDSKSIINSSYTFDTNYTTNATLPIPEYQGPPIKIVNASGVSTLRFPADLYVEVAASEDWESANETVWYNETALIDYDDNDLLPSYLFCACNCTYVSFACCKATDSIVYEEPGLNMGSLSNCTSSPTPNPPSTCSSAVTLTPSASAESSALPAPTCSSSSCTSVNRQCGVGCRCFAPKLSIFFWFSGDCVAESTQQIGRRSIGGINNPLDLFTSQLPAPCNASYVSLACANSTDGIVHEAPDLWLGALLTMRVNATSPPPIPESWLQIHGSDITASTPNLWISDA